MCAEELMNAAWAALSAGRSVELQALEKLLAQPFERSVSRADSASLRRLEMLLAATAKNLRILRGQLRVDGGIYGND